MLQGMTSTHLDSNIVSFLQVFIPHKHIKEGYSGNYGLKTFTIWVSPVYLIASLKWKALKSKEEMQILVGHAKKWTEIRTQK